MSVYCVVQATITNSEALVEYRQYSGQALAKHGGSLVTSSKDLFQVEGEKEHYDTMAILTFPSEDAVWAWYRDEDLQDVHKMRNSSGQWSIRLLGQ